MPTVGPKARILVRNSRLWAHFIKHESFRKLLSINAVFSLNEDSACVITHMNEPLKIVFSVLPADIQV